MTRWRHITAERRAGLTNLAIAAAVAILIWFSAWLWRDPPQSPGHQRDLTETTVDWECTNGHQYQARGAYGIGRCPVCDAEAYLYIRYRCPEHGEIGALLWREKDPKGGSTIAGIRFEGRQWVLAPSRIVCPQCGRTLRTVRPDLYHADTKGKGG